MKKIDLTRTESVDWEIEFELNSNKIPAILAYTDDFEGWLSRAPSMGSSHPDFPSLILKKMKGTRLEGKIIKVTLSYESNDTSTSYPGRPAEIVKRYSIEPAVTEEPLLTFEKLKDLTDTEKEVLSQLMESAKKPEDFQKAMAGVGLSNTLALAAISRIRRGMEAYRNAGLVWVEKFSTKNLEDLELSAILTTTSTPPGPCPDCGPLRNWLYLAGPATPHDDGETYDIERKWEMSLKGKWDEWFYPAES